MMAIDKYVASGMDGRVMMCGLRMLSLPPLALVAACGGGGSDVASTPPPPAGPSYQKLADITASTTLATQAATYQFSRPDNAPIPTVQSQASTIGISYDPASKNYTVRGALVIGSTSTVTQTFGPADAVSDNPGSYASGAGRLDIGTMPLTYTNLGSWTVATGIDETVDTVYFTYGIPTKSSDMPKTGSASYALQISGKDGSNPLSGTGSLTANFAASTVDVSLGLQAREISRPGPNIYDIATVTGSGTISAAGSNPGFSSNLSGGVYSGSINGLFYGPQAAEVGGAFVIGGRNIVGAVMGQKN